MQKRVIGLIIFFLVIGCRGKGSEKVFKRRQYLMGTVVEITLLAKDKALAAAGFEAGFKEIKRLEKLFSVYLAESDFSRINQAAGLRPVRVAPDSFELIKRSLAIAELTAGAYNPVIGPLVKLWGVTEGGNIPSPEERAKIAPLLNYRNLFLDSRQHSVFLKLKGMRLDSGGIGKGYAADRAEKIIKEKGIKNGLIAVSGDIKAFGLRPDKRPWRVGVRHPRRKEGIMASLTLGERAISTSGDYERFFMRQGIRYHHILDPRTLKPARRSISVTVLAKEAVLSDALATGIFVIGPEKGMELIESLKDVEGIIVDARGKIIISSGLKGIELENDLNFQVKKILE